VRRDTEVADASRDLKAGLLMLRAASTEFVAHPTETEVTNFYDGQKLAITCIDRVAAKLAADQQDAITPLRITVRDLKTSFDSLANEQRKLGFSGNEGITAQSAEAMNPVHGDSRSNGATAAVG
jgi:hypothetical protein